MHCQEAPTQGVVWRLKKHARGWEARTITSRIGRPEYFDPNDGGLEEL